MTENPTPENPVPENPVTPNPGDNAATPPSSLPARIAPLWHTALLVTVLIGVSLLNFVRHPHTATHSAALHATRIPTYLFTLGWEWLLLAFVYWGLRMRGLRLRQLLGLRRPGAAEWWTDVAIATGFWLGSSLTLAAVSLLMRVSNLHPESVRTAMLRIAPASFPELLLWIALSISAGICEELIFRGYLQQQSIALTRSVWLGAAISAILFGLAHGYQGISGVLLITLYGAFFSILAYQRRSLRAGMFAHAWQDSFSGIALFIAAHLLHRLPH